MSISRCSEAFTLVNIPCWCFALVDFSTAHWTHLWPRICNWLMCYDLLQDCTTTFGGFWCLLCSDCWLYQCQFHSLHGLRHIATCDNMVENFCCWGNMIPSMLKHLRGPSNPWMQQFLTYHWWTSCSTSTWKKMIYALVPTTFSAIQQKQPILHSATDMILKWDFIFNSRKSALVQALKS